MTCPTLFHFGADRRLHPGEGVEALAAAIAGRPGFVLNVEAAGHAFDNHEAEMFYDEAAAKAAWSKTMAFLGRAPPAADPSVRRPRSADVRATVDSKHSDGGVSRTGRAVARGRGGVRPRCS